MWPGTSADPRGEGGGQGVMRPQDTEVAFWSTAIILIQLLQQT